MRRCHVRKSPCRGAHAEAACKVIQYARRFNTQDNSRRQAPGCTRCIRESFFINIRTRRMRSSRSRCRCRCRCRCRRDLPHCPHCPRHPHCPYCLHCPVRPYCPHCPHCPHHPCHPRHPRHPECPYCPYRLHCPYCPHHPHGPDHPYHSHRPRPLRHDFGSVASRSGCRRSGRFALLRFYDTSITFFEREILDLSKKVVT